MTLDAYIQAYLEENNPNLLLWGPPGAGKTLLTCTFPRFGKKLIVDCFDPQGSGKYRRYVPKAELDLSYWPVEGSLALPSHGVRPGKNVRATVVDKEVPSIKGEVYIPWAKKFHERLAGGEFENAAAYVVDSLTYFSIAAVERQLFLANKPGSIPDGEAGDYDALKMGQRRAFAMMAMVPCPTILIAHEIIKPDYSNKGENLHMLNVTGSVRAELPAACGEIYFARGVTTGARTKYEVQTGPAGKWEMCRTEIGELGGLDLREDVTIDPKLPLIDQGISRLFRKALKSRWEEEYPQPS